MSSIKNSLKTVKTRSYLNRDFDSFRADLLRYVRTYFPDRIQDFSESSVGGMFLDMAAYAGDVSAFYLDHQFKELSVDTAVETKNIQNLLTMAGVKIVGASPAIVTVEISIAVPALATGIRYAPNPVLIPKILGGSSVASKSGVIFEIDDDLDFADKTRSGLFRASDLSKGDINIDDFKTWGKKKTEGKNSFILVSNEGAGEVTPATIQGKIDQHKPDLVILDYHQLFNDNKRSNSEVERNRNISRDFKLLAVTNGIPIIDITAATADDISDQKHPPMMSQVAWSKAIEYDADMAIAVHKHANTDLIEVVSRKNRHGHDFRFFLDWDINRGIITPIYEDLPELSNDSSKN